MCFLTIFQKIDFSYLSLLELFIFLGIILCAQYPVNCTSIRSTAPVSGHFKFLCLLYESVCFYDNFRSFCIVATCLKLLTTFFCGLDKV
jgi:hypothetical protein